MFRNLTDAVLVLDLQGKLIKMNKEAERLTGWKQEEKLGKYINEVFVLVDEKSNNQISISDQLFSASKSAKDTPVRYDACLLFSRDGNSRNVEGAASALIDDKGNSYGWILVFRDVTERISRERELEFTKKLLDLALQGGRIGIRSYHVPTSTIYRNRICNEILGDDPEKKTELPEEWIESLHPDHRERVINSLRRCIEGESDFFEEEYPVRHRSGRWVWIRARGKIIERDEEQKPVWYAGVIFDITAEKEMLEKTKKLEKDLSHMARMESLGRFAGGIAHDFNNLLMIIMGYGEMLRMELEEAHPGREKADQIVLAASRGAKLTRQLLTFSRKQPSTPETFDLNQLLMNLRNMLKRLIGEDIELVMRLSDKELYITSDTGAIEQVLMNLVANSRDAMPNGGKLIIETDMVQIDAPDAEIHRGIKEGNYVMLSVTDTGHGIPREVMDYIFEPFFTTKGSDKGTGLGLSVVYGIVKQSGGDIRVYSEVGKGTTFRIYLPFTGSISTAPEETYQAETKEDEQGRGERILIVEDNMQVREIMLSFLRASGYSVLAAGNGREALALIEKEGVPDLVVTDVVMPEMSGGEFAEEVRKRWGDLPFIYMSGYPNDAIAHRLISHSKVQILTKPFRPEVLIQTIRKVLTERSTRNSKLQT